MVPRKYSSVAALINADESGRLDDSAFDDELWLLLCERIAAPQDVGRLTKPVVLYYASRYVQWEVGNGGFAQAAYNVPEWFEFAASWYEEVGLLEFAALIREAIALLPLENRETTFDAQEIGELFDQFSESRLARLDDRLNGSGWEADSRRVQYVRENKDAFRGVD